MPQWRVSAPRILNRWRPSGIGRDALAPVRLEPGPAGADPYRRTRESSSPPKLPCARSFQRAARADEVDEAPALDCQCRYRAMISNVVFSHPILRIRRRVNPAQYRLTGRLLD